MNCYIILECLAVRLQRIKIICKIWVRDCYLLILPDVMFLRLVIHCAIGNKFWLLHGNDANLTLDNCLPWSKMPRVRTVSKMVDI